MVSEDMQTWIVKENKRKTSIQTENITTHSRWTTTTIRKKKIAGVYATHSHRVVTTEWY